MAEQSVQGLVGVQDLQKRVSSDLEVEVDVMPHVCDPMRREKREEEEERTVEAGIPTVEELGKLSKGELIGRFERIMPEDAMPAIRRLSKGQLVEELREEMYLLEEGYH